MRQLLLRSASASAAMGCVFLTAISLHAQSAPDVQLTIGGLIQAETNLGWVSRLEADRARVGFGLRRTRLRTNVRIGPRAGAFMHLIADNGIFGVLDAFAFYDASPSIRLRVGRIASAQPRAFILTPVMLMDALDRSAIALRWNGGTLGTFGRDFGVDVTYRSDEADVMLFVGNGYGSFDQVRGIFQPNVVGDVTGGDRHLLGEMALSVYGAYRTSTVSGVEIGGFAGVNGSRNAATEVNGVGRKYASYSGHVYWGAAPGSQAVRLKADVVGIRYEAVPTHPAQNTLGVSLLGAAALHRAAEVFGRAESFDVDLDADDDRDVYVTAGLNFSPSKLRGRPFAEERLTVGYSVRIPESGDAPLNQMVSLQFQVFF